MCNPERPRYFGIAGLAVLAATGAGTTTAAVQAQARAARRRGR